MDAATHASPSRLVAHSSHRVFFRLRGHRLRLGHLHRPRAPSRDHEACPRGWHDCGFCTCAAKQNVSGAPTHFIAAYDSGDVILHEISAPLSEPRWKDSAKRRCCADCSNLIELQYDLIFPATPNALCHLRAPLAPLRDSRSAHSREFRNRDL